MKANINRVVSRLEDIYQCGKKEDGTYTRMAFSEEDVKGRELFASWAKRLGMTCHVDEAGNLIAHMDGQDNDLPAIMMGSHLDTVPDGGRYDGVTGCVGGLEVCEVLKEHGKVPKHPIEVIVFTDEEGFRFGKGLLGSSSLCGQDPDVSDDELVAAFLDMVENHKMIVENSGLLTVAALKHLDVSDKRIVSILSGGNMDVITMSSVVQQGLILRDRIFTVSVLLPDKPGELCKVSGIIAAQQGNVIKLEHNQFVTTNRSAAVELRITLECFGTDHKKQIIKALEKEGYKPKVVRTSL